MQEAGGTTFRTTIGNFRFLISASTAFSGCRLRPAQEGSVSQNFEIIQLEIDEAPLRALDNRRRNQLVGCMHAHNELAILNRVLMYSMSRTGEGELHDSAQSVQMWCFLQVLAGKLLETWGMLTDRFLKASPRDTALTRLSPEHKASLEWLEEYFGLGVAKDNSLRIIRDKTAFHYDKLGVDEALNNLAMRENYVYLAEHPANCLYYVGSMLIFRTVFAMIADRAKDTSRLTHDERTKIGTAIATSEAAQVNFHMHLLLYGLISGGLEGALGKPLSTLEQVPSRCLALLIRIRSPYRRS